MERNGYKGPTRPALSSRPLALDVEKGRPWVAISRGLLLGPYSLP